MPYQWCQCCQCLCVGCASSGDLAKHHLGVEGRVLGVLLDCCPSQARHGMASGRDVSELNCFLLCHLTPMVLAVHCAPSHYLHQRLHGNCKSAAGETNPLLNLETFNAHSMCADAAPCICASSQTYGSCTSPAQSNLVTTTTPVTTHSSINKSVTVYVLFEC